MVVCGTNAVAWGAAASASKALPLWPAPVFGVIALLGLYGVIAPLVRIWPFHTLQSPREILDESMRLGQEARERIVRQGLDEVAAQIEYVRWFSQTSAALWRYVPAVADEFMIADADHTLFSGQALLVRLIKAKLDVLSGARRDI